MSKRSGETKETTFGASYKNYEKSIVQDGKYHYYGRGPPCDLSNNNIDLKLLKKKT